jgi:hypothetical protein
MKGTNSSKVIDRDSLVEKLRSVKNLSLELAREDIPQLRNNMELVLSLVNELLFLFDDEYERPSRCLRGVGKETSLPGE